MITTPSQPSIYPLTLVFSALVKTFANLFML